MAKADLHLHSKYSNRPSEWFLQRLGAAQSYTEPELIYEKCKEQGMTFVTITDHNTIEGSLLLAQKYEDAFTGIQTTTYFPEDQCKIHLLIWGLDEKQYEEIQYLRKDIYELNSYLNAEKLAHSVAHATYMINNKLAIGHLERLVLLFNVFESINGTQSHASNSTWYYYLKYLTEPFLTNLAEKHDLAPRGRDAWIKGFTGGSDDHGGIFIGKAYTMANAGNARGFLETIRKRKSFAKGRSNDFHSFAFTVYKVAHDFSRSKSKPLALSPLANLPEVIFGEQKPSLLDRLAVVGLKADTGFKRHVGELVDEIRRKRISNVEENLDMVYDRIATIADELLQSAIRTVLGKLEQGDLFSLAKEVSAAIPGLFLLVPFFSSLKHLNSNRVLLNELQRALPVKQDRKILWFTDTLVDMNGPSVTLKNMGWAFYANGIEVRIVTCLREEEITDELPPNTINLPRIYDFDLPYYTQYNIKIPSMLKAMKELHSFEPDEIFISTPGPVGFLGLLMAQLLSVRAVGIYHTDFSSELTEITDGDDSAADLVEEGLRWFYGTMDEVKVPTRAYIDLLAQRGLDPAKMSVFPRLIDHEAFRRVPEEELGEHRLELPEGPTLLYVGRISKDKNLGFLVDVMQEVLEKRPEVNFVLAGDGPYREEMEGYLGGHERVRFLGKLPHERLPYIYSQTDMLIFPSTTDTFGMVVLEAQCCEVPAVVSDVGGPCEIVSHEETGLVVPALKHDAWVQAILDMIDMVSGQRETFDSMCRRSRERAMATYGWDAVLKGLTSEILVPKPKMYAE